MNSNLLKLNRRNFFEHNVKEVLKLNVSNSGSTIILNNTNNNLEVELPFVKDGEGLFFNFLISEINNSKSIKISCNEDDGQKLRIKNEIKYDESENPILPSQPETEIIIQTTETVRRWVGENIRLECDGSFWFLTDSSFNESESNTFLENNTNNKVITTKGGTTITGEQNLSFDDIKLEATASISYNGNVSSNLGVINVNNNFVSTRGDIFSNNLKTSAFFENDWVKVGSDIVGETTETVIVAEVEEEVLISNQYLGDTMALNYNASVLALGSSRLGRVNIYEWNGSSYILKPSIQISTNSSNHQSNMDINYDGSIIVLSEPLKSNGSFTRNGSFSVYKWSGSNWISFGNSVFGKRSNERFGYNVKINGDGTIIVATTVVQSVESDAPQESVRVYKILNNVWTQMGVDLSGLADDDFGVSVAINGGGNIIAIGAPQRNGSSNGYVEIYKWNSNGVNWEKIGSTITGTSNFGNFVDLSFDGLVLATCSPGIINVDPNEGTTKDVKIYYFNEDDWIQKGSSITGNSTNSNIIKIGLPLSLSADGNTIVVGSPYLNSYNKGKVRVYHFNGDWIQLGTDIDNTSVEDSEEFGYSVRLSKDGKIFIANAPNYEGDKENIGFVRLYNLQEDLSQVAVSNTVNNLTTSTITANSVIDFSIINNIYYTVTFSGSNIALSAINATNVGQQGYICFKLINGANNYSIVFTAAGAGESTWYVDNVNTSNKDNSYSVYKYYIFEQNGISLIGQSECETR